MPITQVVPHEGGGAWGWDSDAGQWVPVDQSMLQGSTLGNLGRAAGRGLEDINLGADQLLRPNNDPNLQARIKVLDLQKEAASRAAPWTEAIGEGLPDVAAGLATTPFTGGLGLPATLGLAGAGGAVSGGIRTGSMEDRVTNALMGAALGVAGVGLGEAALKGVTGALKVGQSIMTGNAASVARGVEVGGMRVQNAASRAALDAATPDEALPVAGRSVGAAETPLGAQGMEHATESAALDLTDRTGANVVPSDFAQAQRAAVEDMGYKSPAWADTRKGSIARWAGGVNETLPWMQMRQQAAQAGNQALAARSVAAAMGHDSDSLILPEIDAAHKGIQNSFNALKKTAPAVDSQDFANNFKRLESQANIGMFDMGEGQKAIDNAIRNAEAYAGELPGRVVMSDRSMMSELMSRYYEKGLTNQGDLMREAIEKLDDLMEANAAAKGDKAFGTRFKKAREQFQVYQMVRRAGAVSPEGDINPATMLRTMARDRASGGFGPGGPRSQGPARKAFDLISVMARDQHGIPPTGVRTAGALANMGIGRAAPALLGGATGAGILNALLGNR